MASTHEEELERENQQLRDDLYEAQERIQAVSAVSCAPCRLPTSLETVPLIYTNLFTAGGSSRQ